MKKVASMLGVIGISLFLLINTGCEDDLLSSLIDLSNINDSTKSIITKIDTVVKTDTIVTIEPIKEIEKNEIYVDNPGDNKDIQPNILIAYNRAKEGDCIVLPAGTFTFSNSLEFKKLVSLKGAGMNQTILYRPETMSDGELNSKCFLVWNINRDSSSHLTISDFTLKSKNPAGMNKLNGSLATDFGIKIYKAVDFVITNCKFENFGYAALWIIHKDALARGLIYKNQFYHNFKGDGLGLGYGIAVYGENLKWIDSPSFGSSNFIYIEDNVFEYHRHSVCGGGNGLYVARYNIIKNNTVHHAIDMHNARGGNLGAPNYFSTRAAEVYKNDIVNTKCKDGVTDVINGNAAQIYKLTDQAITFCGGESVIFENNISGYTRGISNRLYFKFILWC